MASYMKTKKFETSLGYLEGNRNLRASNGFFTVRYLQHFANATAEVFLRDESFTLSVNQRSSFPSQLTFSTVIENRPLRYSADASFDLSCPDFSLSRPATFVFYSDYNRNISAHLQVESQGVNHGFRFFIPDNNWNEAELVVIRPQKSTHEALFYRNSLPNQRDNNSFALSFGFRNFEIDFSRHQNRLTSDLNSLGIQNLNNVLFIVNSYVESSQRNYEFAAQINDKQVFETSLGYYFESVIQSNFLFKSQKFTMPRPVSFNFNHLFSDSFVNFDLSFDLPETNFNHKLRFNLNFDDLEILTNAELEMKRPENSLSELIFSKELPTLLIIDQQSFIILA